MIVNGKAQIIGLYICLSKYKYMSLKKITNHVLTDLTII